MIIFFYRDRATGKITKIHENGMNWTPAEIEEEIANFNRTSRSQTVHVAEIEEGSIFEHLYKLAMQKKPQSAAIGNALEAIREAERALQMLEV